MATAGAPRTTKCSPVRIIFPGALLVTSLLGTGLVDAVSHREAECGIAHDGFLVACDIAAGFVGE